MRIEDMMPRKCCYEDCAGRPTEHDADGDLACAEHAAQSFSYVIVADLTDQGTWLTAAQAVRAMALLCEQGWDVEIRGPRRGEGLATYARERNGSLQILSGRDAQREALEDAVREAADRAADSDDDQPQPQG